MTRITTTGRDSWSQPRMSQATSDRTYRYERIPEDSGWARVAYLAAGLVVMTCLVAGWLS